jgi:hypothetical protein
VHTTMATGRDEAMCNACKLYHCAPLPASLARRLYAPGGLLGGDGQVKVPWPLPMLVYMSHCGCCCNSVRQADYVQRRHVNNNSSNAWSPTEVWSSSCCAG